MEDQILDLLARHQRGCSNRVRAIIIHPSRQNQLPSEVFGIPILTSELVQPDRVRIDCGGDHSTPAPAEVEEKELVYAKKNIV